MSDMLIGEALACVTVCALGLIYNRRKAHEQNLIHNPPCQHVWENTDVEDYKTRQDCRDWKTRIVYRTCTKCGETSVKKMREGL